MVALQDDVTGPADTIREALEFAHSPASASRMAAARAALTELEKRTREALALLTSIDYEEGSKIDRAVRILEGTDG